MPRNAVIHIQNKAAGPPIKMAIATPPMFPVPTVPDKAVLKAWKGEVWPSLPFPDENKIFHPIKKYLNWGTPKYTVKKIPTESKSKGNQAALPK